MFRALSESSRLRILTLLAGRQMSAGALAERMRIPEAAVVDHMKPPFGMRTHHEQQG